MNNYLMACCVDFYDELIYSSFDRDGIKQLFETMKSWGMRRIYWIYLLGEDEKLLSGSPRRSVSENARKTFDEIGEFLPAVTSIAHELDMELYAVYKPFDLGFHCSLPLNTPEANKYGKLDSLGGKMNFTCESLVKMADMRMKRHPDDILAIDHDSTIKTIRLYADKEDQAVFGPDDLRILYSDDNVDYKPVEQGFSFRHDIENGFRAVYLEDLNITSPYLLIECLLANKISYFGNTLDKLITLYNDKGEEIPFSYGLKRRIGILNKYPSGTNAPGFEFDEGSGLAGELKRFRHGIDNAPDGLTAIAKGYSPYIRGALSPAYPEVRNLWLKHINQCIAAGVDGVDIRVANHNRSFQWERYGFEKPVVEACARKGFDIVNDPNAQSAKRSMLGEFYLEFLEKASHAVRQAGKKVQIHLPPVQMGDYKDKRLMDIIWPWKKYLQNGLFDEITIKDGPWYDPALWGRIQNIADRDIPSYLCPYWKSIPNKTDWQKKLLKSLIDSRNGGQAGFILYETAMVVRITEGSNTPKLLYPELPKLFSDFANCR